MNTSFVILDMTRSGSCGIIFGLTRKCNMVLSVVIIMTGGSRVPRYCDKYHYVNRIPLSHIERAA